MQFPFRVLLKVPEVRHIPIFAMDAKKGREVHEETVLPSFETCATALDDGPAQSLQKGRYGAYRVVGSRTRLDPRTALYAAWLSFDEIDAALAFERDHLTPVQAAVGKRLDAALRSAQASGKDTPTTAMKDCLSIIHALPL